jgi:hypothetical protein
MTEHHTHAHVEHHHSNTMLQRYKEHKQKSAEERETKWRNKKLKVIFNTAFTESKKQPAPTHDHWKLSDDMRDTIASTAEQLGKEHLLLDENVSEEQLQRFAELFSSRYQEFAQKHKTTISTLLKRIIVGGNIAIGVAESLTAGSASAMWSDVGHNIADAYVYNEQINNVQEPDSPKAKSYKRRKRMFTILSVSSALLAAKSGTELVLDTDSSADPLALYTAGASVVFNGGIGLARYRQMKRHKAAGHELSHHDDDVNKHLLVDTASAGLAFVGAAAGSGVLGPLAGVASGLLGAKVFFPSEKNLRHSYHAHGDEGHHEHEHHHHDHHQEPKKSKRKSKKFRQAVATATSAAVLLAGGIAGIKAAETNDSTKQLHPSITTTLPENPSTTIPAPIEEKDRDEETQTFVHSGSHLWQQSEKDIQKAVAEKQESLTDIVVDYATMANDLENPDLIQPGNYTTVTADAIQVIYDAQHTQPQTAEEKQFAADLKNWNETRPSVKDEKQKKRFGRIKQYIKHTLHKN